MKYSFGLQVEKRRDILEDYVLVFPLTKKLEIPDSLSVRSEMSPVRNQGQEGSCVGQALGAGVNEYLQSKDYEKPVLLSTRWIYNLARDRGGFKEGATLSDACWIAHKIGIPEKKYWPYKSNDKSEPKKGAEKNALKYRIKSYVKIPDLNRLLMAMNDPLIRVVLIGIKVYKGMIGEDLKQGKTGVVPDPTCFQRALGGHAMTADAYDVMEKIYKKPGWVEAKNSWGVKYGDKGYNKFSFNYIKKNMTSAYACTDIPKEELKKKTVKVADFSTFDIKNERLWIPAV